MATRMFLMVIVGVWTSLPVVGQDILYYKFESGGGSTEVNYGDVATGIPRLGQLITDPSIQPSQSWGPGKFGTGMAAGVGSQYFGTELDTGWDQVIDTGTSLTIALFFRAVYPLPSNETVRLCGPDGSFAGVRLVISSSTGGNFGHVGFSWSPGYVSGGGLTLAQDLLTPAFSNWVHLALVINRNASPGCPTATVQWFVNGVGQIPSAPTTCFQNIAGSSIGTLRVGERGRAYLRYDEFRLCLRAASATEIAQWATTDLSADGPFGDACYPFGLPVLLSGSGGNPTPGNSAYKLTVYGLPGSSILLGLGGSDTTFGGSPLPLDLGGFVPSLAGCQLRVSPDFQITTMIGATGSVVFPLSIPASPGLVGVNAYAQAVLYSPAIALWSSTNAWAVHIGN